VPKFLIERDIPGLGKMDAEELRIIAKRSNSVLHDLGPHIQWIQSYLTADKMFCVYIAPSLDLIMQHARCGAFPVNTVTPIDGIIDPTTGGA
jgi:uncharacterized protein DUF4242